MRKLIMLALLAAGTAALVALPAAAKPRGTNGKIVVNVDNAVTGQEQVYTINPDGTDLQFLANDQEAGQWSPDGTKIAMFGGYLDFDTGDITDLGLPFDRYPDLALFCGVWSPNGARLACEGFGQTDGSLNGVYTIRSSDGGDLQRVTTAEFDDCPADYPPNGKRLLGPRTVELMGSPYAADTLPGRARGEAWGLSVRVITDATARNIMLSNGSFGWHPLRLLQRELVAAGKRDPVLGSRP